MKKNEFMQKLESELRAHNVSDAGDILEEYAQHFAFKLADGYSEEEIAAKLGNPAQLAAQFESSSESAASGNKAFTAVGLGFLDVIASLVLILLAAWGVVMAAAAIAGAALAVCLLGGFNICNLIPAMPYWCGAILALACVAFSVLFAVGCAYYAAFLRQLVRAFCRFQKNAFAKASGKAQLPSLSATPRFPTKTARRMRSIALAALAMFAACFVLAYIVCALSAGSFEFWHAWSWFGAR